MNTSNEEPMDETLYEILTDLFSIPEDQAEKASKRQSMVEFDAKLNRLEALVGANTAYEVIPRGDFIHYRNSELQEYFQLAEQVATQVQEQLQEAIADGRSFMPQVFSSIDALKTFMDSGEVKAPKVTGTLDLSRYSLLHQDHPKSKSYLDSLITTGELVVGDNEYWSRGTTNGPRGGHILQRIGYQLTLMFSDAQLGRPGYKIGGKNNITVDEKTQRNLRVLRDMAYNS